MIMIKIKDAPTIIKLGFNVLISKMPYFPIIASFDVTNKCTLRCKHCYWWLQEHNSELDDEIFYQKVLEIKKRHPTLIYAIWLGGNLYLDAT